VIVKCEDSEECRNRAGNTFIASKEKEEQPDTDRTLRNQLKEKEQELELERDTREELYF
jgi:hypothetical protein